MVDAAAGRSASSSRRWRSSSATAAAGYAALEEVLAAARAAGLLVIADAKRGDIGSTMEAYAQAWLTPGVAARGGRADRRARTWVSVRSSRRSHLALAHGKGVFVLAATWNPEAAALQTGGDRQRERDIVAAGIVEGVNARNATHSHGVASAPLGVVIGATVDCSSYGIDRDELAAARSPILAPGFGHQGATFDQLRARFGAAAPSTVVSVSRVSLAAGPARTPRPSRLQPMRFPVPRLIPAAE